MKRRTSGSSWLRPLHIAWTFLEGQPLVLTTEREKESIAQIKERARQHLQAMQTDGLPKDKMLARVEVGTRMEFYNTLNREELWGEPGETCEIDESCEIGETGAERGREQCFG